MKLIAVLSILLISQLVKADDIIVEDPGFITEETLQCIIDVVLHSAEEHPEISWWIFDLLVTIQDFYERRNACDRLITNAGQTACRAAWTAQATAEVIRLRNIITENMEDGEIWFDDMRETWLTCIYEA